MKATAGKWEATSEPVRSTPTARSLGFGWRVLGSLMLGGLGALSFPPHAAPWLLPFALTGLFVLLQEMTPRRAAYIGQAFGTVLAAVALRWLWGMFGPAAVSLWALIGAFTAVTCGLAVWLRDRLPRVPFPLLAAFAWTGIEYFRSEPMALNFAWLGVGYALVDYPIPCHIAAAFGSYGISFLILLGCAYAGTGGRLPLIAVRLAPLFLVFTSVASYTGHPDTAHAIQVHLVQANSEDDESLFRQSQLPSPATTSHPTQMIVWPELSFYSDPRPKLNLQQSLRPHAKTGAATPKSQNALRNKTWNRLRALAQENHCYFLFGAKDQFDITDDSHFRNTAFLLDPQGNIAGQHVKNHTVHFIKDGVAGTDAHIYPTPFGTFGVGICFDMDYPDVARRLVNNGAECLIVPSNNPLDWGPVQHAQHKQLFQMRAVECGRWLATSDVAGNTFAVAPNGQIAASVQTTDSTSLNVAVGRTQARNLFLRGGWRFGQISLTFLFLYCLWAACPARFRLNSDLSD